MKIQIRPHVLEEGVKNPEYCINNLVADRKGIETYKGISSAFTKAIKQGCNAAVIDLDEHLREKGLNIHKFAQSLGNRIRDLESGTIKELYVIRKDRAICIKSCNARASTLYECRDKIIPLLKQIAE